MLARLEAIRAGAHEAFMLNARGHMAEGTTDNVLVVRDQRLVTPPASDGALEGITRSAVFELARDLGIACEEASLGSYDLRAADEVFLAGTAAELVAVRTIDGHAVPMCPGPVFLRIAAAFDALVRRETSTAQDATSVGRRTRQG
jgi:branched-chain amino acid aminotransferase